MGVECDLYEYKVELSDDCDEFLGWIEEHGSPAAAWYINVDDAPPGIKEKLAAMGKDEERILVVVSY